VRQTGNDGEHRVDTAQQHRKQDHLGVLRLQRQLGQAASQTGHVLVAGEGSDRLTGFALSVHISKVEDAPSTSRRRCERWAPEEGREPGSKTETRRGIPGKVAAFAGTLPVDQNIKKSDGLNSTSKYVDRHAQQLGHRILGHATEPGFTVQPVAQPIGAATSPEKYSKIPGCRTNNLSKKPDRPLRWSALALETHTFDSELIPERLS